MESRLDQMQQQKIDAFEQLEQQRQIESEITKAYVKLILDRLNTQITLTTERWHGEKVKLEEKGMMRKRV